MTITLTGHRSLRRGGTRPSTGRDESTTRAAAQRPSDEPAVCSLGSSFDDTAWAAALHCRPLFAAPSSR